MILIIGLLAPTPEQRDQNSTPEQQEQIKDIISKFKEGNKELSSEQEQWLYDNEAPAYGTTSPEIKIVEFFSFTCPGAAQMHDTVREIGIKYEDQVNIQFRHFPTDEEGIEYSLAAECAHQQDKFWSMYDKLFQNRNNITSEDLFSLARQTGADMTQFNQCLQEEETLQKIREDMQQGEQLGVKGSPTTYINGYRIEKPIPREIFMGIVGHILEADKKSENTILTPKRKP